ncbi:hypothetical protein [Eubacterium oxidoreducens]|uniref:Fibronectin type-III domain-containing protein n=1 Tax=Eubacterium oxidoreducens TaxID=1732 RepID=A0A1G6A315_EUBOX|nr:hypothetical protein [Eubacterium oxidoreducens]SDB02819.1 hypothetical protein SAMN02910417_00204 [Eubacterium oxidoreducens]
MRRLKYLALMALMSVTVVGTGGQAVTVLGGETAAVVDSQETAETYSFGTENTQLAPGSYQVSTRFLNASKTDGTEADYFTNDDYLSGISDSILDTATVVVDEDGTAKVYVFLNQSYTYTNTAYNVSISGLFTDSMSVNKDFTNVSATEATNVEECTVEETKEYTSQSTDEDGNETETVTEYPTVVSFTLTEDMASHNGVYAYSVSSGRASTVLLAFDWANAQSVTYGTNATQLNPGNYTVPVSLMKADDTSATSMSNGVIGGDASLTIGYDNSATLTIPIQGLTYMGITAYSSDWKIYAGDTSTETTDAQYTVDEDGNVNSITFSVPDITADGVYVSMTAMSRTNNVYLAIDWENAAIATSSTEDLDATNLGTSSLSAAITAASALKETDYTVASYKKLTAAIATAKSALSTVSTEDEVTAAVDALNAAVKALVKAGDASSLKSLVKTANALSSSTFTSSSWKKVKSAVSKAQTNIDNRASATDLASSKTTLNNALKALETKKVTKVTAKNTAAKKATVRWKKVSGATGYYVYRSTKKSSGYKKVATVTSAVKYTDKKLSKKTYYYKIVAYKTVNKIKVKGSKSASAKVKIKK